MEASPESAQYLTQGENMSQTGGLTGGSVLAVQASTQGMGEKVKEPSTQNSLPSSLDQETSFSEISARRSDSIHEYGTV